MATQTTITNSNSNSNSNSNNATGWGYGYQPVFTPYTPYYYPRPAYYFGGSTRLIPIIPAPYGTYYQPILPQQTNAPATAPPQTMPTTNNTVSAQVKAQLDKMRADYEAENTESTSNPSNSQPTTQILSSVAVCCCCIALGISAYMAMKKRGP